jgi:hypothetical protein
VWKWRTPVKFSFQVRVLSRFMTPIRTCSVNKLARGLRAPPLLGTALPALVPLPPPAVRKRMYITSSPQALGDSVGGARCDSSRLARILYYVCFGPCCGHAIDILVKVGVPATNLVPTEGGHIALFGAPLLTGKSSMLSTYSAPWHMPRTCSQSSIFGALDAALLLSSQSPR